jgi:hypothetical protein
LARASYHLLPGFLDETSAAESLFWPLRQPVIASISTPTQAMQCLVLDLLLGDRLLEAGSAGAPLRQPIDDVLAQVERIEIISDYHIERSHSSPFFLVGAHGLVLVVVPLVRQPVDHFLPAVRAGQHASEM